MKHSNEVAAFELSELKLNLRSMAAQTLTTANQIEQAKRTEIEGYIRKIVNRRDSTVQLWELDQHLEGTKWLLNFSTQGITNQSLPAGAIVILKFLQQKEQRQRLEYCLEFTKTFGLSKLTAQSNYQVDTSPLHPGWVTYTYQDIQTDLFGFRGITVPLVSGILKGRTTVIQTVYFDGQIWIERGTDETVGEYFQVYTRYEKDDTHDDDNDDDERWQR